MNASAFRIAPARRLGAQLLAVFAGLALILGAVPAAQAAPANIVLFGDSIMANTPQTAARVLQSSGGVSGYAPREGRCSRGALRVGASLQKQTGVRVDDFPCTTSGMSAAGHSGIRINGQISTALRQGKLTPATRSVVIQTGINDVLQTMGTPAARSQFIAESRRAVDRIRAAAPNARISFASYPALVGDWGVGCFVHVADVSLLALPVVSARWMMDTAHDWQRGAARATGTRWIDLDTPSKPHSSCAPRGQRWISGSIDVGGAPYNMTVHLNHRGNDGVAGLLARRI